jgi:hypothetical protein
VGGVTDMGASLLRGYSLSTDRMWRWVPQIGECSNRDSSQIQNRCDPYCPDLARLF